MLGRPPDPETLDFLQELNSLKVGNSFEWHGDYNSLYQKIYRQGKKGREYSIKTLIEDRKLIVRTK